MKLFLILINTIFIGNILHASEIADIAAVTAAERLSALVDEMDEEAKISPGDPFGDTDLTLRYDSTVEWAEIPEVKKEIGRLLEATKQFKDFVIFVTEKNTDRWGGHFKDTIDELLRLKGTAHTQGLKRFSFNHKQKRKDLLSMLFCEELIERAEDLKASRSVHDFIGLAVHLDAKHSFRNGYRSAFIRKHNEDDIDTMVWYLNEFVAVVGSPHTMQSEAYKFSSISNESWVDEYGNSRDGQEQAAFLTDEIADSVKKIKKMLGIRSSVNPIIGFMYDFDDDSYLNDPSLRKAQTRAGIVE